MSWPQLLLAVTNWVSLTILTWLIILDKVPLGSFQVYALIFFFIIAFFSTVYRSRKD